MEDAARAPVFIIGTSRSGSTLLRFIMDSHPQFACPPETGLAAACAQFARVWSTVEHAGTGDRWMPTDSVTLTSQAAAAIREGVDRALSGYLKARGKPRWCDKSLDTYMFAEVMTQVYPAARFIFLTRHVMDVVASGVEACPWGLHRFGYDQFVMQYPGNSVAAIAGYWLACMQACHALTEKHPGVCHHVRYEDLVTAPDETIEGIFDFLGVDQVPGIAQASFRTPHDQDGPGDEKIWFTGGVNAGSMGRGVIVPAAALPAPMRPPLNEMLGKLGYLAIDDNWNAGTGRLDPRADRQASAKPGDDAGRAELDRAMSALQAQIQSLPPATHEEIARRWPAVAGTAVRMIVESPGGECRELHWRFWSEPQRPDADGTATQAGNLAAETAETGNYNASLPVFIGSPASWMSVMGGDSNLMTEIMAGRLRCVNPRDPERLRSQEIHAVGALLGVARIPVARR